MGSKGYCNEGHRPETVEEEVGVGVEKMDVYMCCCFIRIHN